MDPEWLSYIRLDTRRPSTPSHHAMSGTNTLQPLLLCECTHLTEFAVMLYSTSNEINGTHDGSENASVHHVYNASQHIQLQLYVCLALMIFDLVNSVYICNNLLNFEGFLQRNAASIRNIMLLNSLLMLASALNSFHTFGEIVTEQKTEALLGVWYARVIVISVNGSSSFYALLVLHEVNRHSFAELQPIIKWPHHRFCEAISNHCKDFSICRRWRCGAHGDWAIEECECHDWGDVSCHHHRLHVHCLQMLCISHLNVETHSSEHRIII